MTAFNPENFINTETTESNSTRVIPVPEGDHRAFIDKVDAKTLGQNQSPALSILWKIDDMDGSVQEATGREENRVEQLIWLDINDSGGLDHSDGKNVQLGRLRKALGQNQPGQAWAPSMLVGGMAMIHVSHDPDKNDPDVVYARVRRVSPLEG